MNSSSRGIRRASGAGAVALGVLLGGGILAPVSAQAAPTCTWGGLKASTWTRTDTGTCYKSQARIYRYISSYPTAYDGPQSRTSSYISSSAGTNAGHAGRAQGASGAPWSVWLTL